MFDENYRTTNQRVFQVRACPSDQPTLAERYVIISATHSAGWLTLEPINAEVYEANLQLWSKNRICRTSPVRGRANEASFLVRVDGDGGEAAFVRAAMWDVDICDGPRTTDGGDAGGPNPVDEKFVALSSASVRECLAIPASPAESDAEADAEADAAQDAATDVRASEGGSDASSD